MESDALEREFDDLTARVWAEGRAERRQLELEAVHERQRARGFGEVVAEALRRGDELAVSLPGGRRVRGLVVDAGSDFATLQAGDRLVGVHLAAGIQQEFGDPYQPPLVVLRISRRSRSGGANPSGRTPSFQALLHQYDFEQRYLRPTAPVEVGTLIEPDPILGHIEAHAWDHLYLRSDDGTEVFIPVAAITTIAWA